MSLAINVSHIDMHFIGKAGLGGQLYIAVRFGHKGNAEHALAIGDKRIRHQRDCAVRLITPIMSAPPGAYPRASDGIDHLGPTHRHLGVGGGQPLHR